MIADLALGFRLAVGGGRITGAALLRLAMTTIGIALAVAVLLMAASIGNLMGEREARQAGLAQQHDPRPGIDPLLATSGGWFDFHGKMISPTVFAASGSTSPVRPGLDRLPAPGQVVVAPAVAEILDSPLGPALRARLPGTVSGVIGKAGLVDANDLTVLVGAKTEDLTGDVRTSPVYGFGRPVQAAANLGPLLVIVLPAGVALLLPLLIFVTTASRMGAAQRERRLAALRLIGLNAQQVRRVAAGESLVGALAGLVLGSTLFLLLRGQIGDWEVFDTRYFGEDFVPSWPLAVLIVLLVPALGITASIFGLRRTIVDPLGVVRISKPVRRRMWWRWAITILGATLMAATLFVTERSSSAMPMLAVTAGSVLLLTGVAVVLPWAVERLVGVLRGGAPSWQLAVRRLQLDSGTASRVVSGLVVVLAGSILIQAVLASLAVYDGSNGRPSQLGTTTVQVSTQGAQLPETVRLARATTGVTEVHTVHSGYVTSSGRPDGQSITLKVGDCAALAIYATLPSCAAGSVFYVDPEPGSRRPAIDPASAGAVQVRSWGDETSGPLWTVPAGLRRIPAAKAAAASTFTLLVTPEALQGVPPPDKAVTVHIGGSGTPDELADRVGAALAPLSWRVNVTDTDTPWQAGANRNTEQFRNALLAASVFVLAIAALSLLMLAVEQLTERRRPLAALSAAGVPIGVLARASLWQTAIPLAVGIVLAVATGIGLTAPLLRLAGAPLRIDLAAIAVLAGAAVLVVLLVTALTLPLLRSITRLDGIRAE